MSRGDNEEEDFGNDEEVVIGDEDGSDIELDDSFDPVFRDEEKEKPPAQDEEMQKLIVRFNPQSGPARRLLYDLREMMKADSKQLGFMTEPVGNDIFNWEVRLFGFEAGSQMASDMIKYKRATKRDYVELHVTFPPDYPNCPPFVRVVEPRFAFHTGRVTVGGSLCTDILTMESWNPLYDIQSLMVNVTAEILNGKPRIDFANPQPYSLQEAKMAYMRVANDHRWKTSGWLPAK
jgi:ubiquitin-conjugating enzyme E2 Q